MKTYKKLTQIEHILKRPGMYIGSTDKVVENMDIFEEDKIINREIEYSSGLYKIFDEIISNAYDEAIRDDSVKNIYVDVEDTKQGKMISVKNDGSAIDIVIHKEYKVYTPELIFGQLLTSSTFSEEKRITAGTHGLGAKLTNIFSKKFIIDIGDAKRKKHYVQVFENNMQKKKKPIIKSYKGESYVKISFIPDYKRFKFNGLTDDVEKLFQRRTYDISGVLKKTNVHWNNKKIKIKNFTDYFKLYYEEEDDIKCVYQKCGESEFIISNSPGEKFKQVSFVNGVNTKNGGKHVDFIMKQFIENMHKEIKKKYKNAKIRDSFIKDKIWIFINAVIENPSFSSQSKDSLSSAIKDDFCQIKPSTMKKLIDKLDLVTDIVSLIKAKETLQLGKTDTKRKKSNLKDIPKLYDANYAGTKKSPLCTLILTEGDSAKTMAVSGLSAIKKGNDIYGVFPLKGKPLNVRDASNKQIINNNEFNSLKKILGLNMGKAYTKDNINELRYGSILLMMDADVDGSHIKGLIFNLVNYFWPSLLKIDGFIKILVTPVVKVSKKDKVQSFFSLTDYENWKTKTKDSDKYKIKYYKGLGTNTSQEAKEYFKDLDKHVITFGWEANQSEKALLLAFSKKQADSRKRWLANYDRNNILDITENKLTMHDFIYKELIHFSNDDNIRSIPHVLDGLKPSQRKVMFTLLSSKNNDEMKVSQLAGSVSLKTSYHHGEASLLQTIVSMAQNFVGTNNTNLLVPIGQFGSRLMGGKDSASPRYIFTKLNEISRVVFNKNDDFQLNFLDDDGFKIEPEFYIPIVPMILINGAEGIGTGYSTNIPQFKLKDVKKTLINKLKNNKFTLIHPAYEHFSGKITKIDKNSYYSEGIYEINKNKKLFIIKELPIGTWTENYKKKIDEMLDEGKIMKKIYADNTDKKVYFEIKLYDYGMDMLNTMSHNEVLDYFKLRKKILLTNMHCFSGQGKIKKYNSANDILKEFYEIRLQAYIKRKLYLIKQYKRQILIENSKYIFIKAVIDQKLKLHLLEDDKIKKRLDKMDLYRKEGYEYLLNIPFKQMTKKNLNRLKDRIKNLWDEFKIIKKTSEKQMWLNDLDKL